VAPQQEPRRAEGPRPHDDVGLPKACAAVLEAPDPVSEAAVTVGGAQTAAAAARCPPAGLRGAADARRPAFSENAFAATPDMGVPIPRPRPD
jgi:penicillin-insensitive murein endopeptidase